MLEKGLEFATIQRKINEPELHKDFEELCSCMRIKWSFKNEPSKDFVVVHVLARKWSWKPPLEHPNLEVILIKIECELFKETQDSLGYFNLSQEKLEGSKILSG